MLGALAGAIMCVCAVVSIWNFMKSSDVKEPENLSSKASPFRVMVTDSAHLIAINNVPRMGQRSAAE